MCSVKNVVEHNHQQTNELDDWLQRSEVRWKAFARPVNHQVVIEEQEDADPEHRQHNAPDDLANFNGTIHVSDSFRGGFALSYSD